MTSSRTQSIFLFGFIMVCLLPCYFNFSVGIGENIDSYLILNNALNFPSAGYVKSRSWGVPLYEWIAYPLIYHFGITAGKIFSLIWLLITLLSVHRFFKMRKIDSIQAALGCLAIAFLPCTIISGNSILETSQGACFGVLSTVNLMNFLKNRRERSFILTFLFAILATGTRPDYVILLVSITFALLFDRKSPIKLILISFVLSILVAFIPYLLLYETTHSLSESFSILNTGDPAWMRVVKTLVGYAAVIGIPAWIIIVFSTIGDRTTWSKRILPTPINAFFFCLTICYAVRMSLLPDEVEYIYFWAIAFLMWIFGTAMSQNFAATIVIGIALPNLIQLHFFQRQENGSVEIKLGFSPGVLGQEYQKRALNEYVRKDFATNAAKTIKSLGCDPSDINAGDVFVEKFPHGHEGGDQCILSSVKWFARMRDVVLPSQGIEMNDFISRYDKKLLVHPLRRDRGWRRFLRFYTAFPVQSLKFFQPHLKQELNTSSIFY